MKLSRLLILFLIFIIGGNSFITAKEFSPDELKNPNLKDRRVYVSDVANLLKPETKSKVNSLLWNLRRNTSTEAVVVVVPNTGNYTREEFATRLFDNWKVGKADKDNGVIILIVPDQREAWIATGYGVEGVIPDISAAKIINRSVVPYMRNNDLDGAVEAVTEDVVKILSDSQAAEELKSHNKDSWEQLPQSDLSTEDFINFIVLVVIGIFLIAFAKYFYDVKKYRKLDRYSQARGWHDSKTTYLLLGIFSLGLGLIPYWLSQRKYKKARNSPLDCPTCNGKMHKLDEEEDNKYLSASQDLEERLNSVDYDVWVCPDCGTVERYAFPNKFTKYEKCPNCHTVAMSMVKDHVLVPATTRHTGTGEKIYECKYCHNQTRRRYTIPRKEDGRAAAIAAGSILGSAGSRGGGFGGGFGGGRTGGGGGGGRW